MGWQKLITFLAKSLDIRGECINDGLELASSLYKFMKQKSLQMKKGKLLRDLFSIQKNLCSNYEANFKKTLHPITTVTCWPQSCGGLRSISP